jgi:hypothetical protein
MLPSVFWAITAEDTNTAKIKSKTPFPISGLLCTNLDVTDQNILPSQVKSPKNLINDRKEQMSESFVW